MPIALACFVVWLHKLCNFARFHVGATVSVARFPRDSNDYMPTALIYLVFSIPTVCGRHPLPRKGARMGISKAPFIGADFCSCQDVFESYNFSTSETERQVIFAISSFCMQNASNQHLAILLSAGFRQLFTRSASTFALHGQYLHIAHRLRLSNLQYWVKSHIQYGAAY